MEFDGLLFFFLVILIGFLGAKSRLLPKSAADVLPAVLINICYPAMVLETFTTTDTEQLLTTGLPVVIATLVVTAVLFFGSLLVYRRVTPARRPLLCFITGIGNVSYVAIPLLSVFLGAEGMFIAVVHGAVQDFLIWSVYHQLFLTGGSGSKKEVIKKVVTSPCLIAAIVGLILALCRVTLPGFLQMTISRVNDMTAPVALLFLGMLIERHGLLNWRKDKFSMRFALGKVIVLPCTLFAVLYWVLPVQTALLLALLFGSPAPLTATVWAKQYGGDERFAVNCCICSTLLFLVFMSAALLLLKNFGILTV